MKVLSVLLALWLTGVEPQTLQAQTPQNTDLIEDIQVRGNRRFPSDTVKYNLQSKPGDPINPTVIARDVKALMTLGYFDDVVVTSEPGDRGQILVFTVDEKPLVRRIEYIGLKSMTESDVLQQYRERKVGLTQESVFDYTKVRRAESVLRSMLAEKGRQNATIDVAVEDIPGTNAVSVTFNIDEGPKIKIEDIDIVGNEVFSDGQIKSAMKLLKEAGPLTPFTSKDTYHELKMADDITRIRMLYYENGYMRANVLEPVIEVKPKKVFRTLPFIKPPFPWGIPLPFWKKEVDRFYITLQVEENDQYRVGDVKVEGAKVIPEILVLAFLGLQKGEVYNDTRLREGFDNLKKQYGALGYINFSAVPIHDLDEENKVVNLTIDIEEERQFMVNRISFSGNTTTRDKVIRREILVNEGEIFNSFYWDQSLLRLNQLGYFEEIKEEDAEVRPHPSEPEVDITLKVQERGRNSIGFNGGVSGIGGSFLGLSYETNNFLGFGETLTFDISGGTRQSNFIFSFSEPYFMDRPLSMGFSIFSRNYRYDQARDFFGLNPDDLPSGLGFENRLNFEQKRHGFSLYGSYPLRLFQRLGITYQWDNSATDAVNPATRDYFQAVTTQEREQFVTGAGGSFTDFRSRKIIPTFTYSTVNNPMTPTSGQAVTTSFELTGGVLGGNVNYYRPTFEYRFFKPHTRRTNVLAFRFLASHVKGFSNVSVPFYERFYMGGDYDLRGFDFRAISPISFLTRMIDVVDPETGNVTRRPFDDIVYVGGDTQAVMNLEYRIPIVGPITVAPFLDIGNSWVTNKDQLRREFLDSEGNLRVEGARFLPGTNSGLRASTGAEIQVVMPVINAPFRLIFVYNPKRIERLYLGPSTGLPFAIQEPTRDIKFTVGRTF